MTDNDDDIQIRFDKSHLVTIGEKLYGESLELLRELVSNAYDADAENVWIEVETDCLTVRDDGWGMDEEGLKEYCTIGSQNKKSSPLSPRFRRHRIGQFGIGKFAVLSACERFRLQTRRSDFAGEIIFDSARGRRATRGASRSCGFPRIRMCPTAPRSSSRSSSGRSRSRISSATSASACRSRRPISIFSSTASAWNPCISPAGASPWIRERPTVRWSAS